MASDVEARELIAQIRVNLERIGESKARAAELISGAKGKVPLPRIAKETGLSLRWVKQVAKTGKWPQRGPRKKPA